MDNLAKFLTEVQISKAIKELQGYEGVPNDHYSLSSFLHSMGLNIRYLGRIYKQLEEQKHIQMLIQRDLVIRSFRHVFIELVRECSPYFLQDLVSHLLNCLLAPEELLKALNNRKIKPGFIEMPEINKLEKVEKAKEKKKQKKRKEEEEKGDEEEPLFKVSRFF